MIGTRQDREHLDRLARERIAKRHTAEATLDCIEHRISAFYREVELGGLMGDLDTEDEFGMVEWLGKHLLSDLGQELRSLRTQVKAL